MTSQLRFDYSPDEIDSLFAKEKAILDDCLTRIAATKTSDVSFSTTVGELERVTAELSNRLNLGTFLKYVSPDQQVRAAADRAETAVSQLFVDLFVREDLFEKVKAVKEGAKETLSPEDAKLLDEYLSHFKRNGLELPPEKRAQFVQKKKRLVEVEAEFAKNLVENEEFLELGESDLEGLPTSYVERLKQTPEGKYKVTLAYPDYFPFMDNSKRADLRQALEIKFFNRGGQRNLQLLDEALKLRHETARLLGYPSHAHFVLEKRMAKEPGTVQTFLSKLLARLLPKGRENVADLLGVKRKETGNPKETVLRSSDWRYYENQIKKERHQIDPQVIKEYFPMDVVLKGMFEIYQTLLGVKFVRETDFPRWHDSVDRYRVVRGSETVAHFYMDLFPRDSKYGHAAAFTLVGGFSTKNGGYVTPVSAIVANFNAPTKDRPSLLEHGEVETLFHEFGHIMHQVLTRAKHATFSGTSVKRDFVEAPSQMLESWVWEKAPLTQLSGHYLDPSKKLPAEQIDKLLAMKNLNTGLKYLRQLVFATLDMRYHSGEKINTTEVYRELARDIGLLELPDGTLPQASFGHLMGGYDAGYYGYLWSEVFAADMYTRFENEGLLNPKTGQDYVRWILEPGGQKEPMELIRGFLGREPNEEAFLKTLGL